MHCALHCIRQHYTALNCIELVLDRVLQYMHEDGDKKENSDGVEVK